MRMTRYLHFVITLFFVNLAYCQTDICDVSSPTGIFPGHMESLDNTGGTDDGDFQNLLLTGPITTWYYAFNIGGTDEGTFQIDVSTLLANDVAIAISTACPVDFGVAGGAATISGGTGSSPEFCLESGVTYIIAIATSMGEQGVVDITITQNSLDPDVTSFTFVETSGNLNNDGEICEGESTDITVLHTNGSGTHTYTWDDPASSTTQTITVSPTMTTTYMVTVEDSGGCTDVDMVNVVVYDEPDFTVAETDMSGLTNDDSEVCIGEDFTLTPTQNNGTGPFTYDYGFPGGGSLLGSTNTSETFTAIPAHDGAWSITVTDGNGCSFVDNVSINMTINALPTSSNTELRACDIGDGTADFMLTDADAPSNYPTNQNFLNEIDNGAVGNTITYHPNLVDADNNANVLFNPHNSGPTTIYARIEEIATGCYTTAEVILTVVGPPMVSSASLQACEDAVNTDMYTYELGDADGSTTTGQFVTGPVNGAITNSTVVYYDNLTDALNNDGLTGLITSPYTVDPSTLSTPNTVFAAVTDDDTGCFAVANVDLLTIEIPVANTQINLGPYCNGQMGDDIIFTSDDPNGDGNVGYVWEDLAANGTIEIGGLITDMSTGDITGWTAVNTGTTQIVATITVTPYSFNPPNVDDNGMGDDCIDPLNTMTFTITVDPSPTNDICDNDLALQTLSAGLNGGLTNQCATITGETVASCAGAGDASVWYTYTVGADVQDLTIDWTLANSSMAAYFDPTDPMNTGCATAEFDCDTDGNLVIPCVSVGDVFYFAVNSAIADAGTFDITITEGMPLVAGDICTDATYMDDGTGFILECGEMATFTWDMMACPDDPMGSAACGPVANTDPGVWWYFEVAADVNEFDITGAGTYELFFSATQDDCTTMTSLGCAGPYITDATGGYFVWLTGGDVTINPLPVEPNEVCGSATVTGIGTTPGNNTCAMMGPACGGTNGDHVVYFTYTTGAMPEDITIGLDPSATLPAMTDGSISVFEDCAGTTTNVVDWDIINMTGQSCDGLNVDVELKCVPPATTLTIAIGSDDLGWTPPSVASETGHFDLTITVMDATVPNDLCANAQDATAPTDLTNICADPEATDCGLDGTTSHDVWYFFNPTFTAADITINVSADGASMTPIMDASVGIYDNTTVCALDPLDPCDATMGFYCGTLGTDIELSCVTTPIVFYVGSPDMMEGDFTLTVTEADAAPSNDMCATPDPLVTGLADNGCATLTDVTYCGLTATDHDIWYTYTNMTGSNVDLDIDIAGTGTPESATDVSMVVLETDCATAFPGTTPADFCNILGAGMQTIECIPDGATVIVGFGSPVCMNGEFNITVTETPNGVVNDECDGTLPDLTPAELCVFENMCLDNTNACPEDWSFAGCGATDMDPVVYGSFTVSANATSIEIENITGPNAPYILILDVFTDCTMGPTAISPCLQGAGGTAGTPVPVTGGSTYLILAGDNMEGPICFDIKVNEAPVNDDCTMPDALTLDAATAGSTVCATSDITTSCAAPDQENTVFYTWTAATDLARVTIDITNYTNTQAAGTDNITLSVFDDCASITIENQLDLTPADFCGKAGTDLITLDCIMAGETFTIMVSSSTQNEGTFDITIREIPPTAGCDDNDDCNNLTAFPHMDVVTDDPFECHTICNEFACPDAEIDALCGGTVFNLVFYEFTTDGNFLPGDEVYILADVTMGASTLDNPVVMILEGTCGGYTLLPNTACYAGVTGPQDGGMTGYIQPNTTYTIAVGTTDNVGGDFDLCIQVVTGCANDICNTAVQLIENTVVTTSTQNCTMDVDEYQCNPTEVASAWYIFNLPAGFTGANITVSNVTPGGNDFNLQAFDGIGGCGGIDPNGEPAGFECSSDGTLELTCLNPDQDYYIQVSTLDMGGEIDFDIEVDFLMPNETGAPDNDVCNGAIDLTLVDCTEALLTFDNTNACPDVGLGTSCTFDMDPTVWFSITLPPDGYGLILDNFSADSYGAVFDACPATTVFGDCVNMGSQPGFIALAGGATYYIALANPNEGSHSFSIQTLVSPPGDSPCIPYDVSAGAYSNSTCCAIGSNIDDTQDFPNAVCNGVTDDHTVWIQYTPTGAEDGVQITYSGPNAAIEVSEADAPAGSLPCTVTFTNPAFVTECNVTSADIIIPICDPNQVILVKVSTANADCGIVNLDIQPYTPCAYADVCDETSGDFNPVTDPNGFNAANYECIQGCLEIACPETAVGECGFANIPTVWFQVDVDMDAAQMYVNVTNNGSWDPVFSIYEGTCPDGLSQVSTGATPGCNTAWNDPAQINQPVDPSVQSTYWIGVGADNYDVGDDPNFTICVLTTIELIICLGDGSCNPDANFEVTVRSNDEDGSLGLPLEGPFCQGETVTICGNFFYDASETGVDWLIGIVPYFGPGWDLSLFDPNSVVVTGNGQAGQWYDDGVPILQEPVGTICTYTDIYGNLQICNGLCTICTECTPGMMPGDALPGGWFWVSNGGNAGCDNDGTPGEGWGIGSTTADVDYCIDLVVREFSDMAECELNKNLNFGFQTFSDGVAGCWEDPVGECLLDESQTFVLEAECNVPPPIQGGPVEICTGFPANLDVSTADGSVNLINITPVNNPSITGATSWTFPSGFGTITDVLTNTSNVVQSQFYEGQVIVPGLDCPGPIVEVEVIVYPELIVEFPYADPTPVCYDDSFVFVPQVMGGTDMNYTYSWTDGSTDPDIEIFNPGIYPVGIHQMCVTVTDNLGCMGENCFNFDIRPEILVEIVGEDIMCKDCEDITDTDVTLTLQDNSMPPIMMSNLDWDVFDYTGGDLAFSNVVNGELWIHDKLDIPGVPFQESDVDLYDIMVTGTDEYGCEFETDFFVFEVVTGPEIIIDLINCTPNGSEYHIESPPIFDTRVEIFDKNGGPTDPPIEVFFGEADVTLAPGCYTIVSDYTDSDCVSSVELVVEPAIPAVISSPTVCLGNDGVANVLNCGDYMTVTWDAAGTTGCMYTIPNLLMDTTFVITLTDVNGCAGFTNVTIETQPNPDPMITGSLSYCAGSSTTLGLSEMYDLYSWSTGDMGSTAVVSSPGTVTVTVTDANGCIGTTSVDVSEDTNLNIPGATEIVCNDGSSTATFDAGDANPNYTFTWDANAMADGVIGGTNMGTLTTSVSGTYSVTVTDASAGGCTGVGMFTLNYEENPTLTVVNEEPICNNAALGNGSVVDITDNASGSAGSWTDDNAVFGGSFDPSNMDFDGFLAGDYFFTFCTNTAIECENVCETITVPVDDCDCPVAVVGDIDTLCNDVAELIDLDAREVPPNMGTWTFNGADGGMTLINANAASSALDIPQGTAAGNYSIVYALDGLDPGCGIVSDTIDFVINQAPSATVTPDVDVCNEDTGIGIICVDFNGLVTAGDMSGSWTADPQFLADGGDFSDLSNVCFDGLMIGSVYFFTYTTGSAIPPCQDIPYEVTIRVQDCNCKNPATLEMPTVCAENQTLMLSNYVATNADPGNWTLTMDGTGDVSTITVTTSTIEVSANTDPGTYVFQYDNINPTGGSCVEFSQQTLTVVAPPTAALTQTDAQACSTVPQNGGAISNIVNVGQYLDATSSAGDWTDDYGLLAGGQNINMVDFDGVPIGTVVEFTYTTNTGQGDPCDDVFVVFTVTVVDCDCPPIDTSAPEDLCTSGGSIDLTTLEGNSDPGTWTIVSATGGADISTVIFMNEVFTVDQNTDAGTYTVEYTLDNPVNGCTSSLTEEITVVDPPVVVFNTAEACNQEDVTGQSGSHILNLTSFFDLTMTTSTSGDWSSSVAGLDLSDPTAVDFTGLLADSPITITFTTNDATAPCGEVTGDLIVNVIDCDCPNLTVTDPDPVCNNGTTVDLSTAEGQFTVDGSWSEDPSNPTTGILSGDIVNIDNATVAGVYTFIFTPDMAPNAGCPETSSVMLTVNQSVTAGTAGDPIAFCDSETGMVDLASLLTGEDANGTWIETSALLSTGGAFDANVGSFTVDGQNPGVYEFTYSVTGTDPCPDDDATVVVVIEEEPVADAGMDGEIDCLGDPITVGGPNTSTGGDYTYVWTNAAGETVQTSTTDYEYLIGVDGTYTLTVIDNVTGCTNSDDVFIATNPEIPVLAVDPCTDMGQGIIFIDEASGFNDLAFIEIMYPDGTTEQIPYDPNTTELTNLLAGPYEVTLIDVVGCRSVTQSLIIVDASSIITNTLGSDTLDTEFGTVYPLNLNDFLVDDQGTYTVEWYNQETGEILCPTPQQTECDSIEVFIERAETICVRVTDEDGCVNEECVYLRFKIENDIFTPNIFNPGLDETNGWLYPITDKDATTQYFRVYDRWGNLVFVNEGFPTNTPNLGWDGTFGGVPAEQGVYIYMYGVEFPDGEIIETAKDITLIR